MIMAEFLVILFEFVVDLYDHSVLLRKSIERYRTPVTRHSRTRKQLEKYFLSLRKQSLHVNSWIQWTNFHRVYRSKYGSLPQNTGFFRRFWISNISQDSLELLLDLTTNIIPRQQVDREEIFHCENCSQRILEFVSSKGEHRSLECHDEWAWHYIFEYRPIDEPKDFIWLKSTCGMVYEAKTINLRDFIFQSSE